MTEAEPGPVALVGSGEYLPQMAPLEAGLLAGRPPRYVQLATAAVPDGPRVVDRWHQLGREQAARLGVEAVIIPVGDRADADDPKLASHVRGAGLIYLSGGHPAYLADTLRGSAVWSAIVAAWRGGAALAGCSAGAMAMAAHVPSLRAPQHPPTPGLGLLPHLRVIPHYDRFAARFAQLAATFSLRGERGGVTVVGVDEETALVGGPETWTVQGRQSVWRLSPGEPQQLRPGSTLSTPLVPGTP